MSGHHPFRQLTKDFSPERLEAIRQRRQVLEEMDLYSLLMDASIDWEIDPNSKPIERVAASLEYLRQVVKEMGGELAITAKFPNDLEIPIDTLPLAEPSPNP
jgi:hypothetical protein